ncbi:putative phospholipid-transporting atpase [Anaeramoeba flamelloides]|uniref:Phospholipid-transporting ATPase n=1 Tax=Anaeramoeba flamelloides TaxID=1746091 RepID=A0ABQ8YL80_9EUKA|nr:putative phospholipid-transporting atpase [Anaeramoeba flamelloides]
MQNKLYFPFSPLTPTVSVVPLVFVLSVTAIREAYEDFLRHRSDKEINNRLVEVLREGEWQKIFWKNIRVGDITKIYGKEFFPADIALLSTTEPKGMCYIDTCNLDGETNLKVRQALPETNELNSIEKLSKLNSSIACELPNNNINNFDGTLNLTQDEKLSLTKTQLLLRGCALKNTKSIIGIVVFTGKDTKLIRNSKEVPSKRSSVEIELNSRLITIFLFLSTIGIVGGLMSGLWQNKWEKKSWYLGGKYQSGVTSSPVYTGFTGFFSFIIVTNVMIPISLYVTLEIVKLIQSFFINWDKEMYHEETDTPAKARTSNLTEEIGIIDYIFSDKTGTLTCNIMEFMKCSVGGISYGEGITEVAIAAAKRNGKELKDTRKEGPAFQDRNFLQNLASHETSEYIQEFLIMMGICHTVLPEADEEDPDNLDKLVYQAASPDEGALANAARMLGYKFCDRTPGTVSISINNKKVTYELLNILEFNSTRKRMSIIVRDPEGNIILYCKGADNVIYERLNPKIYQQDNKIPDLTLEHLGEFATEGLRTLCFASRTIEEDQYLEWNKKFKKANTEIKDRKNKVMAVCEEIEVNLKLVGCSAIEDKLQDGVPDAIELLARAGIKLWVLTGDKQETAINIGFACSLLTNEMDLLVIEGDNEKQVYQSLNNLNDKAKSNNKKGIQNALIITGRCLTSALLAKNKLLFLEFGKRCVSVICCRVSPLQKAQVVDLVRENVKNSKCLAIGDGANDVSMIQAAHVGVGISGQEGLQAVMSSDYAIAQFRFLTRLLLVHGRWCYKRATLVILYSFYKNVAFSFMQILFGYFSGWSAQTLFPAIFMSIYNVFFTSLPILVIGVLDQDVSAKSELKHPQLYSGDNRNNQFSFKRFWVWIIEGVYHACVMFFIPTLFYKNDMLRSDGKDSGFWLFSILIYSCVVFVVNLKCAIETTFWTWVHHVTIWGSVAVWFIFVLIFSNSFFFSSDLYQIGNVLFKLPFFWLTLLFVVTLCLLPDILIKFYQRNYSPKDFQIIQEQERIEKKNPEGFEIEKKQSEKFSTKKNDQGNLLQSSSENLLHQEESNEEDHLLNQKNWEPISYKPTSTESSKYLGYAFNPDFGGSLRLLDAKRVASDFKEESGFFNVQNFKKYAVLNKEINLKTDTTESSEIDEI